MIEASPYMNELPAGRAETSEKKKEIVERLLALWERWPALRLGQLIGNVYHSTDTGGCRLYYAEDDVLLRNLEETYATLERRRISDDGGKIP